MKCVPFGSWATFGRYQCVDCDHIYEHSSDRMLPVCPNIEKRIHTMNCWKEVFFTPKEEETLFDSISSKNQKLIKDLVKAEAKGRTILRRRQPDKADTTILQNRLSIKGTDPTTGNIFIIYLQGEHIEVGDTIIWDSDKRKSEEWQVEEIENREDLIICKVKRNTDVNKETQKADEFLYDFKGQSFGEYKIHGKKGYGKSAVVFWGFDSKGKKVAIKIFNKEIQEKYGKETQLKRIKHELTLKNHKIENLVQLFDGGSKIINNDEYFYIIMEYIEGQPLSEYILKNGPQNEEFSKRIFEILFKVTEELLKKDIFHRDIKPENIMIKIPIITLLDLGVIKLIKDPNITDVLGNKPFIGTLRYAPPELLFREEKELIEAWRAINLYQIGGVIHDIMMGTILFSQYREPYSKLVVAIREEIPTVHRNDFSSGFCRFVNNLLAKDWKKRLELFNKCDLDKILHEKQDSTALQRIQNIKEKTKEFKERKKRIQKKSENLKKNNQKIAEIKQFIKKDIKRHFEKLKNEDIFSDINLVEIQGTKREIAKFLIGITGNLEQGFAERRSTYFYFTIEINEDSLINMSVIGLNADYVKLPLKKGKSIEGLLKEINKSRNHIEIFEGVYDSEIIGDYLLEFIPKIIEKSNDYMQDKVRETQEFLEKIIGKSGSHSSKHLSNFLIDKI